LTLYIGSALGLTVFLIDWFKVQFAEGPSQILNSAGVLYYDAAHGEWRIVFMMASFYLCMLCLLVQAVISAAFPHQHTAQSERLVWSNPLECLRSPGWPGIGNYKFLSVALAAVMIILYAYFA
jgi:hypothetical protein